MKTATLISSLSLVTLSADAQIAQENFDNASTWTNDIASKLFVDPNSSDQGLFIQASEFIGSGNVAHGQDLAGESDEPSLHPYRFTFSNVDISTYTQLFKSHLTTM